MNLQEYILRPHEYILSMVTCFHQAMLYFEMISIFVSAVTSCWQLTDHISISVDDSVHTRDKGEYSDYESSKWRELQENLEKSHSIKKEIFLVGRFMV